MAATTNGGDQMIVGLNELEQRISLNSCFVAAKLLSIIISWIFRQLQPWMAL